MPYVTCKSTHEPDSRQRSPNKQRAWPTDIYANKKSANYANSRRISLINTFNNSIIIQLRPINNKKTAHDLCKMNDAH